MIPTSPRTTHPARRPALTLSVAALLAIAGLATPALPQEQPAQPAASTPTRVDLDAFLARQIERIALMDLRTSPAPQATDYGVATLLCQRAEQLTPDDVELVRRRAEAAWNWGDKQALDSATRRIIELDRKDTLAQIRLLSARFESIQTVEDKLAAFDRVGQAKDLDPSVRSRFLLDAALLAREQGDDVGFVSRLSSATDLDLTNKDAAVLALSFFEQRSTDRWGRLDLLINVLLADPLDPQIHMRLAREFAAGGAYDAARRFNRNVKALARQAGIADTATSAIETTMLDILCDGPGKTYADYNRQIKTARDDLARRLKILEDAQQPIAGLPKPEDIRLDMDNEAIRIDCALMMGDQPGAATAVHELGLTAHANATKLEDPLQRPADMKEEDAIEYIRIAIARAELWRLGTGIDLDLVDADLPAALKDAKDTATDATAVSAMAASRKGDFAKAAELLAAATADDPWLTIAAGLNAELSGDFNAAIKSYRDAQEMSPVAPQGVLGGILAERVQLAHSVPPSPELARTRARLIDQADKINLWVDAMAKDPSTFEYVYARLDQPEADALAPAYATLTLKNTSPIPLALGSGKPINSRLLIAQSVDVGGHSLDNLASAEVIDAQRRLRLLPGEAITVRYAMDEGPTGWLLETLAAASGQIRLRIVQGFEIKASGSRDPGPGCLESLSTSLQRRPFPEGRLKPAELADLLKSSSPQSLPALLVAARTAVVLPPPEGVQSVIDSLTEIYPTLSPKLRTLLIAVIPPASELPELAPLDEAIAQEEDPSVLPLALITRAKSADSPLLAAALASNDGALVELANLHKSRLVDGVLCYATKGTGLVQPLRDLYDVKGPDLPATPDLSSTQPAPTPSDSQPSPPPQPR